MDDDRVDSVCGTDVAEGCTAFLGNSEGRVEVRMLNNLYDGLEGNW